MRIARIRLQGAERLVLLDADQAVYPIESITNESITEMGVALEHPRVRAVLDKPTCDAAPLEVNDYKFRPPTDRTSKIIGIGLNYVLHAGDLDAEVPTEPATFIKGTHVVIGPGDEISLPEQSQRVTSEAELGLVIGRHCFRADPSTAWEHVAGVVPVLDQTAEDILQRNARFLTTSKNFPTFLSLGPVVRSRVEWEQDIGDLSSVTVATYHNGQLHRSGRVSDMKFSPPEIVSYLSRVMPLFPGDVICTGTPGAVAISPGSHVACVIDGLPRLENVVVRTT